MAENKYKIGETVTVTDKEGKILYAGVVKGWDYNVCTFALEYEIDYYNNQNERVFTLLGAPEGKIQTLKLNDKQKGLFKEIIQRSKRYGKLAIENCEKWIAAGYAGGKTTPDKLYCYCKKGFLAKVWSDKAQLKKCFKDRDHALEVFTREIDANLEALQASGLFFTFTSDPMLADTRDLTIEAIFLALSRGIPSQILTKRADFLDHPSMKALKLLPGMIAWGFTLTGHDDLEPGASPNIERIHAMKRLHDMGFKTFASIEPVVDFPSAFSMINLSLGFCDLYKIGLMSGKRYNSQERSEADFLLALLKEAPGRYYLKESLIKLLEIDRADLPADKFVGVDFNIFK